MKKNNSIFVLSIFLILPLFILACRDNIVRLVERETLFTIEIGPMEDQIALFQLEGDRGIRRTGFTMRDGLFYIADGNSGKIVCYNAFGDLLFMIYNEETNPAPLSLRINIAEDEIATRWATTYPLNAPSWITVDSRRHIFAADLLPQQAHRFDTESGAILDSVILKFDQEGRFLNFLGREGLGGSPFPRIVGLSTSIRDEIAVICRIPAGWNIHWFNSSGMLLFLIKIDAASVPAHPQLPEAFAMVDTIFASPDSRQLFIKIDYSRDTFDPATNIRTGTEPIGSIIWILDIESGTYSHFHEIPLFELTHNGSERFFVYYSMLGVMRGGRTLLYFPVEEGFSILFADTHSGEQRRGMINFSHNELVFSDFHLSPEGILSAMLADNFNIKITWWRTDRFIGGLQ